MPTTFKPLFMRDVDLILGDEASGPNFKCQLKSVQLTPDTDIAEAETLCPDGQFSDVNAAKWTLELGYYHGTADEGEEVLADFLLENHGEKVPFAFRPVAGGAGYGGTVTLVAGGIGGEVKNHSEQSVELPVQGQPVKLSAVVTP